MSFKIETAKTGRAKCKDCKRPIAQGEIKVVRHGFNQWAKVLTAESVCKNCGLPLLKKELLGLQAAIKKMEGSDDSIGEVPAQAGVGTD